jgi:hypothetical protein
MHADLTALRAFLTATRPDRLEYHIGNRIWTLTRCAGGADLRLQANGIVSMAYAQASNLEALVARMIKDCER